MIYLDYSATTPVREEVLDTFIKVTRDYIGNPNSLHKLGVESKRLIEASTKQIASLLGVKEKEIIYTSGATEANNLAIKGVCEKYQNRGKHIITTRLEHSSVTAPISYLVKNGYDVDFVELDENGLISIDNLKKVIREDTILVSICSVNSEIGLVHNIEEMANFRKGSPKFVVPCDLTQSIGKIEMNLENVDLISFSAQKFYGLKGIGCLIKKENITLEPIIHGGKSTTIYRSGTPAVALIASLAKALRLIFIDSQKRLAQVKILNQYVRENLKNIKGVHMNSNSYCSPYILNISIENIKSEVMLHALEEEDIYLSTQTACSSGGYSSAIFAFTKNKSYAENSLRISLSYLTTKEELTKFLEIFQKKMKELELSEGS